MPQYDAPHSRMPAEKAQELFRYAWAAFRSQFATLALMGMGIGVLNQTIDLMPTALRIAAGFVLSPVLVLGFYRACLEALCGKKPRWGMMLCGAKNLHTLGNALLMGLPAALLDVLLILCNVGASGLYMAAAQNSNTMLLSVSVLIARVVVQLWYLYRFSLLEYTWLTGRAGSLRPAVDMTMKKTRGTLGYAVRFAIGLLLCYLPVLAVGGAAGNLIVRAGVDTTAALSAGVAVNILLDAVTPFFVMARLTFAASYFDTIKREFSSTEGLV